MAHRGAASQLWTKTSQSSCRCMRVCAFDCSGGEQEDWNTALSRYDTCIRAIAAGKKVPWLVDLDRWWRHELPAVLKERAGSDDGPHLTREELVKVMKWKLNRGKFRPLISKVESNAEDKVIAVTREALEKVTGSKEDVKEAIACMDKGLCGIGPATASAILAAYRDDLAPFMADESLAAVPALGPIKYTLAQYMQFRDELARRGRELGMPAELVGRALWCTSVMEAYGLDKDKDKSDSAASSSAGAGSGGSGSSENTSSNGTGSSSNASSSGSSDSKGKSPTKRGVESPAASPDSKRSKSIAI